MLGAQGGVRIERLPIRWRLGFSHDSSTEPWRTENPVNKSSGIRLLLMRCPLAWRWRRGVVGVGESRPLSGGIEAINRRVRTTRGPHVLAFASADVHGSRRLLLILCSSPTVLFFDGQVSPRYSFSARQPPDTAGTLPDLSAFGQTLGRQGLSQDFLVLYCSFT
jgi:hypothetical protein